MLFDGARADLQLAGNFFVAASLHQQLQNFGITNGDFDFSNISHGNLGNRARFCKQRECVFMKSNSFTKSSPAKKKRHIPLHAVICRAEGMSLTISAGSNSSRHGTYGSTME